MWPAPACLSLPVFQHPTTSAGVDFSLGYPEGEKIPYDEMPAVVSRIAGAVAIPVSADVQSGYGDPNPRDHWDARTSRIGAARLRPCQCRLQPDEGGTRLH
jgi:hypothetical protein